MRSTPALAAGPGSRASRRLRSLASLASLAAVAVLACGAVVGCGSSDSDSGSNAGASASASSDGPSAGGGEKIEFVSFAPASDPFWNVVANGAKRAGEDLGVSVNYQAPKQTTLTATDLVSIVNAAIAKQPDGIVVADTNPSALNPLIKKATDSGIPVIMINQGAREVRKVGALTFVGSDEVQAGTVSGEKMTDAGARHVLYVTIPPGNPTGEARDEGFYAGYRGKITELEIPSQSINDATMITNAIRAGLQKDSSIDSVFGMTSLFSASMDNVRKGLADRAQDMIWACFDLGPTLVNGVEDGTFLFAVDQQQFLQGYLPVQQLTHYLRYGITPVQEFEPTGPLIVTRDNVGKIVELARDGVR